MFYALERTKEDSMRFLSRYSKGMQFKTYEYFIPEIFYLIFWIIVHHGWPQVTEITESKTMGKGELLYISFLILAIWIDM